MCALGDACEFLGFRQWRFFTFRRQAQIKIPLIAASEQFGPQSFGRPLAFRGDRN